MRLTFLIVAPNYTHRSSGVRALYRLCHHLNNAGYPSAIISFPGQDILHLPSWDVLAYKGEIRDSIVIYPEVISGNPYGADRVVRWVLNTPGLLGGDKTYPDDEMVFVYDSQRLAIANKAVSYSLGSERVLWVGLVDPMHIYPNPSIPKTLDCSFSHKGRFLQAKFPLKNEAGIQRLEDITPTMSSLGDVLRRTRTLYSYDHYSNVLREAVICGCNVLVIDEDGHWHDPQTCECSSNILWAPNFRENYSVKFHDGSFVEGFIRELETRWLIPRPTAMHVLTEQRVARIDGLSRDIQTLMQKQELLQHQLTETHTFQSTLTKENEQLQNQFLAIQDELKAMRASRTWKAFSGYRKLRKWMK